MRRHASSYGSTRIRNLDTQLAIRIPSNSTQAIKSYMVFQYEFDHISLMPVSRRANVQVESTDGKNSFPWSAEQLTWEKRKDVFVPTRLEAVGRETYSPQVGKGFSVENNTVVRFSWLKVNEPLDETLFAADSISRDILHKALDPQELGLATKD